MSEQIYNRQAITQYLLGALSEAEAEHLDELSLTDDEFADALRAAENDLVDAYVQGELTGPALEKFEAHYLASPRRREKVKFAQAFQVFAQKTVIPQAVASRAETPAPPATKRSFFDWLSALSLRAAPRPAWQWGAACVALALLIAGGWLAFENVRLRRQLAQTHARRDALGQREQELRTELEAQRTAKATTEQELARVRAERARLDEELRKEQEQRRLAEPQSAARRPQSSVPGAGSIVAFSLAPQMRGVGQIPVVSVPAQTDYMAMRLDLEPDEHSVYRVALLDEANKQTLWRSGRLKAGAAGDSKTLSVSFRADLLGARVYVLRVTGVSADGAAEIVGDYPFRVVK
jgi:hypothetical protein